MTESTSAESRQRELKSQVRQLLRQRRFDEAIDHLATAVGEQPDSADLVQTLGTTCFAAGRLDDAKTQFERLVRLRPADVNSYVNLGAVLNRAQDYRGALDALRRGIQRDRRSAAAYYNMGIAHRGSGNRAMAVTAYRDALDIDPDMVDAHLNLANVLLDMGNHQQAILHYKEALNRRPDFEKARRGLAKAEQKAAEARQAFSPFGRLVKPSVPETAPTPAPKSDPGNSTLNPEERSRDRRTLLDATSVLTAAAGEFAEAVRSRLEGAIVKLNKAVAGGKTSSHLVPENHENFEEAMGVVRDARNSLLRGMAVLREHEDEIAKGA